MEEPEQYDDDMLQELDFDPSQIEEIDNTNEAEVLGDQYLPIMQGGYMFESQGYEATQTYLSKFYDGLTLDKDLSSRENLVVKNNNNNDVYVSVPGTTGLGDAVKTWGHIISEDQQSILNMTTGVGGKLFAQAGLMGARQFTDRQTYNNRVQTTEDTLDKIAEKYGDTDTLLMGHSLGGAIVRKVALDNNLSSIIYNSAVGKHRIFKDNLKKNIELRIKKDVVSMSYHAKPREYSIEKGYSLFGTLKAHDLTNFIINKDRYDDILTGRKTLVRRHPLDYKNIDMISPKKYRNPDAYNDFYDRKCPSGSRYNPRTDKCERF